MTKLLKTIAIEVLCFVLPLDDFIVMQVGGVSPYEMGEMYTAKDLLLNVVKLLSFIFGVAIATSMFEYFVTSLGLPAFISAGAVTKTVTEFFTGMWVGLNGILVLLHVLVKVCEVKNAI